MKEKICFRCNVKKQLNEFYVHKQMSDGHLNKCKTCTKDDTKKRHEKLILSPEWHNQEKERHRLKYYRLGYQSKHKPTKELKSLAMNKYLQKYPEKQKAAMATRKIEKTEGYHLHHWSYNEEHHKDVIELETKDHYLLHRHIIYDQERMMYRRVDNMQLLDTKEKHIGYFNTIKTK